MLHGRADDDGGLVVGMHAFYRGDPSSNPAEVYSFLFKFLLQIETIRCIVTIWCHLKLNMHD